LKPFIQELPRHYGRSPQDAELQRVLENMAARVEADKDFTLEQLFPSTASGWGLALWEDAYGLRREAGQTERQRRARVLAKIKGVSTTTVERIRGIAQVFSISRVEVEERSAESRFIIWYVETIGEINNKEDLVAIINELKPAHLAWSIKYRETFRTQGYAGMVPREAETFILRQENKSWPRYTVEVFEGFVPRVAETFILRQEG
jgi:uncharacterized protein YmfQ (DUF2313 family)